jgi:hypothetical protein
MPVRPTALCSFRARFWRDAHLTRLVCGACRDIIGSQRVLPKMASHLFVALKLKLASCCLMEGDARGATAFCAEAEAIKCSKPASLRARVRDTCRRRRHISLHVFLTRARRVF